MNSLVLDRPEVPATLQDRLPLRAIVLWANVLALLAAALFLRCWHLGNIPGFNGDEAWYGVQAMRIVHGSDFQWLTPTGNPINAFFLVPLVGLHYFLSPSILLLRTVSLASGLAALVVNYWLCRRTFDEPTAVVSTLLLALLPINIAYSRFAWDASQSLLATLFVMYLPLLLLRTGNARRALTVAAIVATVAAIIVHPTNVFVAVFLIVPAVYTRRQAIKQVLRFTTIPAKPWVFVALVSGSTMGAYLVWRWAPAALAHLHGPGQVGEFLANYLRLFSGTTIYQFISGAGLSTAEAGWFEYTTIAGDVGLGLMALIALWGVLRRLQTSPAPVDVCLVVGWLTMLAAFFLIAGPEAIAPHFERYGICLIAPATLVVARGLVWWIERRQPYAGRFAAALSVAAWLWLLGFYVNYFQCIVETGGASHRAFRTAAVEPKLASVSDVLRRRRADKPIVIVCHEWWNYWPVAYLAFEAPRVRVVTWEAWRADDSDLRAARAEDTWFVEFTGSRGELEAMRAAVDGGELVRRVTVEDYSRRPLISVLGPAENLSQNN